MLKQASRLSYFPVTSLPCVFVELNFGIGGVIKIRFLVVFLIAVKLEFAADISGSDHRKHYNDEHRDIALIEKIHCVSVCFSGSVDMAGYRLFVSDKPIAKKCQVPKFS